MPQYLGAKTKPNSLQPTPLLPAARNGYGEVGKLPLQPAAHSPDQPNARNRTAPTEVAGRGHEGVVKPLLQREDIRSNRQNVYRQTPFFLATSCRYISVMKQLLAQEIFSTKAPDNADQTPTHDRSRKGIS